MNETGDLRLPFFLFHREDEGGRRAHWIPGFRAGSPNGQPSNVGVRLTMGVRYDPQLVSAPLGAPVGRDLRGAEALLRMRLEAGPLFVLPTQAPRRVSLSCQVKGDRVHEPVTGWKWPLVHVWPSSAASSNSPAMAEPTGPEELAPGTSSAISVQSHSEFA